MPIYEFECLACGHRFERLQKLSAADPTDCPSCREAKVKRAVTAAAFRLKGSGWYETDFKGDKDQKRNLVESGGEAKPAGDAKPTESKVAEAKHADAPKAEAKPTPAPAAPAAGA
ncbi:MAG: zinc ribbon domain-containing protein [Xanthomonadales bacterium]|nr:hypothetical protein [Xanthomonadales bacterium]MCC6591876.1 zinc ribbon domain-containing protein [Xanthomonadales bacterium]